MRFRAAKNIQVAGVDEVWLKHLSGARNAALLFLLGNRGQRDFRCGWRRGVAIAVEEMRSIESNLQRIVAGSIGELGGVQIELSLELAFRLGRASPGRAGAFQCYGLALSPEY